MLRMIGVCHFPNWHTYHSNPLTSLYNKHSSNKPMNTTVTITLTPQQQTALADALYIRAMDLQHNVPGTDRNVAMNEVAACLLDQMDYPVHEWMN